MRGDHARGARWRCAARTAALLTGASLATAAGGCGSHSRASTVSAVPYGPLVSCDRTSRIDRALGFPEVIGHGPGERLWGLIMAPRYPLAAGEGVVKIVWRVTGRGPLRLTEHDGRGVRVALAWGPVGHGASNYSRPGDEWGAGYRFRRPGCYHLTARRTSGHAGVWLRVSPASKHASS